MDEVGRRVVLSLPTFHLSVWGETEEWEVISEALYPVADDIVVHTISRFP